MLCVDLAPRVRTDQCTNSTLETLFTFSSTNPGTPGKVLSKGLTFIQLLAQKQHFHS